MKRQHLYALDISQPGNELRALRDVLGVISQAGRQHKADPNRFPESGQAPGEIERWPIVLASQVAMLFRIPGLNTQQHQIDLSQLFIRQAFAEKAVGLHRGVNPHCLRGREKSDGKTVLHQRLAAA